MTTPLSRLSFGRKRTLFAGALNSHLPFATSVTFTFGGLIVVQGLAYLILGTGRAGMAVSESLLVIANILSAACAWLAFRRAQGYASLFWCLFLLTQVTLLPPTVLLAAQTISQRALVSPSTWRVLYCFYGTPILMMLFLPVSECEGRVRSEVYLDLFQITIVATLGYYIFFLVPLKGMLPGAALLRNLDVSNVESVFLLSIVLVRLRMVHTRQARDLLLRLGLFVLVCGLATYIGNEIDSRELRSFSAWWDLGWTLPYAAGALVAITYQPIDQQPGGPEATRFSSFVSTNLVLVGVLTGIHLLTDKLEVGLNTLVMQVVIGASLFAFALRLSLTQFRQHIEILQRKKAEQDLTSANEAVAALLDDARTEAAVSAQLSQLASLLQACTSRQEVFQLLPDFFMRLLPLTSGSISVLNPSRTRAEVVTTWTGQASQMARPDAPPPTYAPLMANGLAIGVISVQHCNPEGEKDLNLENAFNRRSQIAHSVAEHVSSTIAQIDLRDALRTQAIRDPLTGLFNRRHMEEALQREIQRARRRHRALSVMLLDIDHFKRFNDTYGHSAGDQALILVGETLSKNVRAEDYACRYGGEEFLVILTECSLQQAANRAEQIRNCIRNLYTEQEGELPVEITTSIGVTELHPAPDRAELLIKRADEALYQAKHEGRDRVVLSSSSSSLPATSASLPGSGS